MSNGLVTANQFQLVPNMSGAIGRGVDLHQKLQQPQINQLSRSAAGGDQSSLSRLAGLDPERATQIQKFNSGQTQNSKDEEESRIESVMLGALQASILPDDESKLSFLKNRRSELASKNIKTGDTDEIIALYESGNSKQANALIDGAVQMGVRLGKIKPSQKQSDGGFTLSEGQTRFGAGGEVIARGSQRPSKQAGSTAPIPDVLLAGLDEQIAAKGAAAFQAAGGGKDGLTAFQKIVDAGTEQQRRLASPAIIKNSFPNASKAETIQLQATMDSAKTTETGLKAASKVREDQRRTKKAKAFQVRAVELLDGILASGEGLFGGDLGDVLGSIEGSIDFRLFSDDEAQIIADIEEATNILTADNMDLMTGVLSESDIKILKSLSGGALNRKRTEERFVKDVTTIRDKLSSQQVLTVDDLQVERDKNTELKEGAIITNKQTGERLKLVNGQFVGVE